MQSCVIIGAGIAGLTAARQLVQQGWTVTVLDKGRGLGGRLATRRLSGGRADHGAQVMRATSVAFNDWLTGPDGPTTLTEWPVDSRGTGWIGRDGMNQVAKQLATGLTVETEQIVVAVRADDAGWQIETESGQSFRGDALLCTIPAPQALTLFGDKSNLLGPADERVLRTIQYDPCLTVLVALNRASLLPEPGGLWVDQPDIA